MGTPQNVLATLRLSDLRLADLDADGNSPSLDDQKRRIVNFGATLGWKVTRVMVENDLPTRTGKVRGVSAFKRRKIRLPDGRVELRTFRPVFREALELLATGRHDGLLALDLDRTARDPRDLEDLIDVVEQHRVPVQSVTGSLRLANDADITMARVMVAMANKESRDKRRRVAALRERQALAGSYGGGRRPYGFDTDGITIRPDEAEIIVEMSRRVIQAATVTAPAGDRRRRRPDSLKSLAAELRCREVPTVTGTAWSAQTLRDILLRPRNAGRTVYQGQEIGDAPWGPIIPVDMFRTLVGILTDPNRQTGPGTGPKWLGSGLYRCGVCDDGTTVQVRIAGRAPGYRCSDHNHLVRNRAYVDALVVGTVLARLALPDAIDLFLPTVPEVDTGALRAEAGGIREQLKLNAVAVTLGRMNREEVYAASAAGNARLAEIDALLQSAAVASPLAPLIGVEDIQAAWESLDLAAQRLVIGILITVTILPSGRKGRGFDPNTVRIDWKHHDN